LAISAAIAPSGVIPLTAQVLAIGVALMPKIDVPQ
jgi:hypothetical protein